MRLRIQHATHYAYDAAPSYLVQRLYLTPVNHEGQRTIAWKVNAPGIDTSLSHRDGFGNIAHLITVRGHSGVLTISAEGEVETSDTAGVVRGIANQIPDVVYLRQTAATTASPDLLKFAARFNRSLPVLELAHAVMRAVHEAVTYEVGSTHAHTTAAEAFKDGRGVCQDHAHIMIALARHLGLPARYVTGYLVTGVGASSAAAHAWAEIMVADLGWVGFDAANGQCPTDHYVRIAAGLDAAAVAPVRGFRRGGSGAEQMTVEVRVEIAQQ
ncbi:MAG: transglutaminase family protein [Rhizobiales bacterium]|nr:transglutaminase family protein [Hyphomicrobiales bacterium]